MSESVTARRDGRVGRIVLDRPRALNALDLGMLRAIRAALEAWRAVPEVHAVVVESANDRAFCAGGDVRTIRERALAGDRATIHAFFAEEYALNLAIAEYPKPYVALVDGVAMGGGIGISVHGRARVATEAAVFAMPEAAIGMVPDVGATHFLPRLPGRIGTWMGLTGARLGGAEAVHAGLATHYVPRARLADLSRALAEDGIAVLAAFAAPLPPSGLAGRRAALDRCFAPDTVAEITARLEAEEAEWARDSLAAMRAASPTALAVALAAIRAGAHRDLAACLAAELRIAVHVALRPDFAEGVRAVVVDKDRRPSWSPARPEDVDMADVRAVVEGGVDAPGGRA